ncbi:hypothetical protein BMF94_3613 [Rhodotorula taiwanensis]|uniref:Threonine/serine exporter-like N-terminal domain-containing protein n=1 Tax=Rhodotorula taiwanensis TaxID=741276 RepID=A0A2S5B941_9BASI|nr:hypothetical protein BMF94_3613 [Rhodotorula taiwanensis]
MADSRRDEPRQSTNPFDLPYAPDGSASATPIGTETMTPPRLVVPGDSDQGQAAAYDFADTPPRADRGRGPNNGSVSTTRSHSGDHSSDETVGDHTASSITMLDSSQGSNGAHRNAHAGGRRVQWTPGLTERPAASHLAIEMNDMSSPTSRDLASPGASAELARALEAAAASSAGGTTDDEDEDRMDPTDRRSRFFASQGTSTDVSRAASSDGDPEERLEALKDNMEVYVDPGETDGLPSVSRRNPEDRSTKAAWNLVRNMTLKGQGAGGSLRRRRQANAGPGGFTSGNGAAAGDVEKADETAKEEGGVGRLVDRIRQGNIGDVPEGTSYQSAAAPTGGILSALIALQQQQQQEQSGSTSVTPSGASTPTSLGPSSRRPSSAADGEFLDEDEEEAERLRFLAKLHEKRARKNQLHYFAESVGSGVTGVGSAAGRGANAVIGSAGRGAGAVIGTAGRGAGAVIGGAGKAVGAAGHALGVSSRQSKTPSAENTPATGEAGEARPRAMQAFFNRTRQAVDKADRPDAARSSAGVFGGLVLGAAALGGVSTPTHATLTPDPTKEGTHLSRWDLPTTDSRSRAGSAGSSTQGSPVMGRSAPTSPPLSPAVDSKRNQFSLSLGNLKDLPQTAPHKLRLTPGHESPRKEYGDYFTKETEEELDRKAWEKEKRRRRKEKAKRKAHEVFITQHVAAILERQQFIMKQARAFMMFGAPSHRLEAQMQATARVLEINCQVIYIPGVMLVSFGDAATHTSDIKFLKQSNGLDLGKLLTAYLIYYRVIHDQISVTEASRQLDELMVSPPKYALWQQLIIGAAASAFIQPSAFYGSFIDCLMAMPLGALLVLVQVLVSRNDLYSSLFEIVIACVISFIAAALASTHQFCFSAVVSGAVVLILPGYIVLCGSLELANRSIISGSVRLVYAILYSLFLGFGLSIGSEIYARTGLTIYGSTDYTCSALRGDGVPWYRNTIPPWWYFLTIPMYLLVLALRNGQPLFRKETLVMIVVGSAGFVSNYFSGKAFINRPDISSAIGSFAVGILGNLYGKFTRGSPFVVMVPGVLIQLPSGLSNGGLLRFTQTSEQSGSDTLYSGGFSTASSLVEVAIGLTVGLFTSAALVNIFGGGRRRGSNLSSF